MAKVVAVDDSPTAVALLDSVLRHMGHEPLTTTDSVRALELVQAHRPELVISDIFMPTMDGYGLVEQIRSDPAVAATPVILWTATYLASTVKPIADRLLVHTVLAKPCEPETLIDAIESAIGTKVKVPDRAWIPTSAHLQHLQDVAVQLREQVSADRLQLQETERKLAAEREHNQLLFDNHPIPMFVFDVETAGMLEVNEAALWRYGYTRPDFLQLKIDRLLAECEARTKPHDPAIRTSGVITHQARDGSSFEAETTSYDFTYGRRPARFVTAQDVTQKRKLERQLQQAQRLESLGQLAGGVAHDFNNLLAVIMNFTAFARRQVEAAAAEPGAPPRWERVARDLVKVERAAEHAAGLTRQLLRFARRDVSQPRPTDVNVAIADISQLLHRTIGEHIEVSITPGAGLWPAMIDPGQLGQVLTNLTVNSRDAMPGGGTISVETSNVSVDAAYATGHPGLRAGRYVDLCVTDTGTGMAPEAMEHLFEPFFTTKPVGKGTGLGLATVHGIVTQAGGYVSVYSQPNTGTRVHVLLPATDDAPTTPGPAPEAVTGSGTVLVVEDEREIREVIHRILTEHGFDVLLAADGAEAITVAEEFTDEIDLLLTDIVMPHVDGKELAKLVQKARPQTRVLFMSGYAQPSFAVGGTLAAGLMLLEKPFTETTLVAKVTEAMGVTTQPAKV